MIKNYNELKDYIREDKKVNYIFKKKPKIFGDVNFKFFIFLRLTQYSHYTNKKVSFYVFNKFKCYYAKKMMLEINTLMVGKGLRIPHIGPIIINSKSQIGNYCEINSMVNIGNNINCRNKAPIIGNNVFIGPGAKIFGDIQIADNIKIGANAVVNKNFMEEGSTLVGVPARAIKNKKN